jgi:probable addiction module antidote protein
LGQATESILQKRESFLLFFLSVETKVLNQKILPNLNYFGRRLKMTTLRNFDDFIVKELNNPEFASDYLQDALEEGGIPLFLIALRQIVQHQKGLTKVAEETGLGRESLYKTLSEQGNPHLSTIEKILKTVGMKITVIPDQVSI